MFLRTAVEHVTSLGFRRPDHTLFGEWYAKTMVQRIWKLHSAPPFSFEHLDGCLVGFAESCVFQSWWLLSLSPEGESEHRGSC